jgi:hypothetical protein
LGLDLLFFLEGLGMPFSCSCTAAKLNEDDGSGVEPEACDDLENLLPSTCAMEGRLKEGCGDALRGLAKSAE